MRRALITAVLVAIVAVSSIAQTPANVEKANRFRITAQTENVNTDQIATINTENQTKIDIRVLETKNSAQLKELGSRYALAHSENASQLKELGSRYALAHSENASQLKSLGSK